MASGNRSKYGDGWLFWMTSVPVITAGLVAEWFTDQLMYLILLSVLLAVPAVVLGMLVYNRTWQSHWLVKSAAGLALSVFCIGILMFFSWLTGSEADTPKPNELDAPWHAQQIGTLTVRTPDSLEPLETSIPHTVRPYYQSLQIYANSGKGRLIAAYDSDLTVDTIPVGQAYYGTLESILGRLGVSLADLEFEEYTNEANELETTFQFNLNGLIVRGYGLMYKKGRSLDSVWLIPLTENYSEAFIDHFSLGIEREGET